jgi:hypothetical protein
MDANPTISATCVCALPERFRADNMKLMRLLALFVLATSACFSQRPLTFGVKGGVPLTGFLDATQFPPLTSRQAATSTTNPYILGPTVELRLPSNLAIELDALFRHFRYQTSVCASTSCSLTTITSNVWEVPLLLKYNVRRKIVKPYIDGGMVWDRLQGLSANDIESSGFGPPTTLSVKPFELKDATSIGLVLGAGVEIPAGLMRISPEIRYTRWTSQQFAGHLINSKANQADFLLGITF